MTDRFTGDTCIERAPAALSRRVLDGVLVLAPDMSEALQISAPGDAIWDLLREPLTVSELVNALAEHYGEPPETIRAHIRPVLDALLDGGALVATGSPR